MEQQIPSQQIPSQSRRQLRTAGGDTGPLCHLLSGPPIPRCSRKTQGAGGNGDVGSACPRSVPGPPRLVASGPGISQGLIRWKNSPGMDPEPLEKLPGSHLRSCCREQPREEIPELGLEQPEPLQGWECLESHRSAPNISFHRIFRSHGMGLGMAFHKEPTKSWNSRF